MQQRTSVCVIQPRNNTLIQYFDNSTLFGNKTGTKETLKQNLKTKSLEQMNNLISVDNPTTSITEHVNLIEKQYENHKIELESEYWSKYIDFSNGLIKDKPTKINVKELGTISKNQRKTIVKAVENLSAMVLMNYQKKLGKWHQQYLTFVTLTLPYKQMHSDKILRKSQTRFLENLTKTYKVQHYIWKAETQQNGNIHFHLLIDRAVKWQDIRRLWNKQLNKLGYIEKYAQKRKKEGFIYKPIIYKKGKAVTNPKSKNEQYKSYLKEKEIGFTNPNTTDIHSLQNITNSVNYILKYLTKLEPTKRPIIGAVWGCSNITKKLEYPKFYESEIAFQQLNHLIKSKELKCVLKDDFFSVYSGKIYAIISKKYKQTWHAIKTHYSTLKKYTKQTYKKLEQQAIDFKKSIQNQILKPLISNDGATKLLKDIQEQKIIIRNKNALQRFKNNYLNTYQPLEANQLNLFTCQK